MAGFDKSLTDKEARKNKWIAQATSRKEKSNTLAQQAAAAVHIDDASSESSNDSNDDDFHAPLIPHKPKRVKRGIITKEVAAALDHVKLPDRGALYILGAVAQALGVDLEDVALSRNTIQRALQETRSVVASLIKATFVVDSPVLLHWDSKLLPDISGNKEIVDRVAILITSGNIEKLLAVPKISCGTGQEQCNACIGALDDLQLRSKVQGLVFDTTSSNTGLHLGTCTLIEKALKRELIWIACRHHVFEVMLFNVFSATVAPTSGPDIFKRFQKKWPIINKSSFEVAADDVFAGMPNGLRQEMIIFYKTAITDRAPHEDYRELLQLCLVFLGGEIEGQLSIRAPGAILNPRWMAKTIYSIKICLFKNQMQLTAHETLGLMTVSVFVSMVYARFWHEAALPQRAPLNDIKLLHLLHEYPECCVSAKVSTALRRHLW